MFLKSWTNEVQSELISKYRNQIMGIAIIWIVLFHSSIPAPESLIPRTLWYLFISFGGGVGVNIFLMLSGFGLNYSHSKKRTYGNNGQYWTFIKSRLLRILPAYLIVAVIYFGINDLIRQPNWLQFVKDVSMFNYILDGDRTYWYIFAIIIYYLLFPLLMWASDRFGYFKSHMIALVGVIGAETICYYLFPDFWEQYEIVIVRAVSFIIGSLIGRLTLERKRIRVKNVVLFLLSVVFVFAILLLNKTGYLNPRMQRYLFVPLSIFLIYLFAFIFSLFSYGFRVLEFFGRYSLEIYLCHIACAKLPGRILNLFNIDSNPYADVLLLMIISIVFSIFLKMLTSKTPRTIAKISN